MTGHVYALGDSVMQGAGPDLYATLPGCCPGIEVDAVPNRQMWHAPDLLVARLQQAPVPAVIVVHLGTNGLFSETTFDAVVAAAGDVPLAFVNIKAPRDWEGPVNERLATGVERHGARACLVDWHAVATRGPTDHLKADGFHLSRIGAVAYAEVIAGALARSA